MLLLTLSSGILPGERFREISSIEASYGDPPVASVWLLPKSLGRYFVEVMIARVFIWSDEDRAGRTDELRTCEPQNLEFGEMQPVTNDCPRSSVSETSPFPSASRYCRQVPLVWSPLMQVHRLADVEARPCLSLLGRSGLRINPNEDQYPGTNMCVATQCSASGSPNWPTDAIRVPPRLALQRGYFEDRPIGRRDQKGGRRSTLLWATNIDLLRGAEYGVRGRLRTFELPLRVMHVGSKGRLEGGLRGAQPGGTVHKV